MTTIASFFFHSPFFFDDCLSYCKPSVGAIAENWPKARPFGAPPEESARIREHFLDFGRCISPDFVWGGYWIEGHWT